MAVIVPARLGYLLATMLFACSFAAFAGQRVVVEGAPVTVEVPEGWVVAPVSSDRPYLGLTLCDPERSDANSCLVLGEMDITQLTEPSAPASAEVLLKDAQSQYASAAAEDRVVAPRRLTIAGRDALESASIGKVHYNLGSGKGGSWSSMLHHGFMILDGPAVYRCSLKAAPARYTAELRQALTQFCSSIQFTGDRLSGKQ